MNGVYSRAVERWLLREASIKNKGEKKLKSRAALWIAHARVASNRRAGLPGGEIYSGPLRATVAINFGTIYIWAYDFVNIIFLTI